MFRILIKLLVIYLSFSLLTPVRQAGAQAARPKNVIMMIMDGANSDAVTLTRWYQGKPLALDRILVGGAMTNSYRSAITDSAAAATALATGHKSIVDAIGMIPAIRAGNQEETFRYNGSSGAIENRMRKTMFPAATVLEAAQKAGKATGIISTSPVQHATPAAYSSHVTNRSDFQNIAEQQVYEGIDVVLGGGLASLIPGSGLAGRKDGENLLQEIQKNGYSFADTKAEMLRASSGKLWGAFAGGAIANEQDRTRHHPEQPSLKEMTGKAIEILNRNKNGFFLFIEGSKVDWAAHLNDPVGMISEIRSFDEAVKTAVDFAEKDRETLVIAVTDHGNSGLTIGSHSTDKSYAITPPSQFIQPLKKAEVTLEGAMELLKRDRSNLQQVVSAYGLDPVLPDEWQQLLAARTEKELERKLAWMLGKRAKLGFTTYGHTGEDVFLYAYGPGKPSGLVNNTDIPKQIAAYWGMNLDQLSKEKFTDAHQWYTTHGYQTFIDNSDPENPVFTAKQPGETRQYPVNKNYMFLNGTKKQIHGVTVRNGNTYYIPVP